MTETGWSDLQNLTEQFQQPFQLFREGKRTLLQVLVTPRVGIQYSLSSLLSSPTCDSFCVLTLFCKISSNRKNYSPSDRIKDWIRNNDRLAVRILIWKWEKKLSSVKYFFLLVGTDWFIKPLCSSGWVGRTFNLLWKDGWSWSSSCVRIWAGLKTLSTLRVYPSVWPVHQVCTWFSIIFLSTHCAGGNLILFKYIF